MTVTEAHSNDSYANRSPAIVDLGPIRQRGRGAYKMPADAEKKTADSVGAVGVTTPVSSALKAFVVTIVVVVILGGQGLVKQAQSPGQFQAVITGIGNLGVGIQNLFGLGWPWRDFQVALGHGNQFQKSSLLAIPTATPTPRPHHHGTSPGKGNHHRQTGKGKKPHPAVKPWPKLPIISKHRPLRFLVTGDSLPQYMAPQMYQLAGSEGPVVAPAPVTGTNGTTWEGTGLCRPDFFAWDVEARSETRMYHPDAVVVLLGGNDFQNMLLGSREFFAGTKAWTKEYERRAVIVMQAFIKSGAKRVYWLSLPPPGDGSAGYAHDFHQIDVADKAAAARVPGVRYVNINPAVTYRARYVDYKRVNGQLTLIRESDGIHLNIAGSQLVSNRVVPVVKRDFRFGWTQVRRRTHHRHRHQGRHQASARHHRH